MEKHGLITFTKPSLSLYIRLEYIRAKRAFWTIEQPSSSLLPYYKPMEARVILVKGSLESVYIALLLLRN